LRKSTGRHKNKLFGHPLTTFFQIAEMYNAQKLNHTGQQVDDEDEDD